MKRGIVFIVIAFTVITLAYAHDIGPFREHVKPNIQPQIPQLLQTTETRVSGEAIIEFEMDGMMIFIPITFPGSDEEYYFLFDTGAMSVIDDDLAVELGLEPEFISMIEGSDGSDNIAYNSTVDKMFVGDITVEDFRTTIFDVSEIDENSSLDVYGIIGADLLRHFVVTVDYENQIVDMTTSKRSIDIDKVGYMIPFESDPEMGYIPVVECIVNNQTYIDGIIDTGYNGFAAIPLGYLLGELGERDEDIDEVIKSVGSMGGGALAEADDMYILRLMKFQLGNFTIGKVPVVTRNIDQLLIGYEFLSQFVMTLDFSEEICYLYPRELEFPSNYYSFGFGLEEEGPLYRISGFWENSPADRSDLEIGDIVLEINSIDVDELPSKNLDTVNGLSNSNTVVLVVSNRNGVKNIILQNEPLFTD